MADLIFSYGFKGDFYFYSPNRQIASAPWAKGAKELCAITDINRPLCVAVGPSLDWFFGYQAIDGRCKWVRRREKGPALKHGSFYRNWSARQASYDRLESWLDTYASSPSDMHRARVALGPQGSFFATSPAGGVTWDSVPATIQSLINPQRPGRVPTLVALGVHGTWFALWPNGSSSCNLADEYPDLEILLRKHGQGGINSVTLSAIQSNQFTISFRDGYSHISGPVSEANLRQLNNIKMQDSAETKAPMQVQVCGLYNSSPPVELPQPILNVQRIIFPCTPGDRMGRKYEKGAKVVGFVGSCSSSCVLM